VFHRQNLGRDSAKYRTRTPVLIKGIDSEARNVWHLKKIGLKEFLEILALPIVHDVVNQRLYFWVVLGKDIDASYITINP
jgi:hypothetical protein